MTAATDDGHGPSTKRWPLIRLAAYGAATVATIIAATILTRLLVPPAPSPWHDLALLKNALLPIALFLVYAGLVQLMERRPAHEVALRPAALIAGIVIGAALIGATVLILCTLGMARVSGGTGFSGIGRELLVLMITSMSEELLFRVILLAILEEMLGSGAALLISAAAFGLAHAGNPGATPSAIVSLSVQLGVMLALAYMLTRNVWAAVGIHAGWNFAQSFVFGALNSGQHHPFSYFQTSFTGPAYLTGGAFGLEGSVISLALCLLASAVMLALVVRKKRWLGLRFRLRATRAVFADA